MDIKSLIENDNTTKRSVEKIDGMVSDKNSEKEGTATTVGASGVTTIDTEDDSPGDISLPFSKKTKRVHKSFSTGRQDRVVSVSTTNSSMLASTEQNCSRDEPAFERCSSNSTNTESCEDNDKGNHLQSKGKAKIQNFEPVEDEREEEENDSDDDNDDDYDHGDVDDDDGDDDDLDIPQERLDSEELNLEDDVDAGEESLFRRIIAMAAANGIPLEVLAAHGIQFQTADGDDSDDEHVEYPFDKPPTSLDDVANFILSDKCQRILCLTGAGVSVASGIPDFRSSNGLYATLDATKLTATKEQMEAIEENPSFVLDQHLFNENPLPCLEVNREFILGVQDRKWKATLAHRFIELLHTKTCSGKRKLVRLYTQNIDGLEDQCTEIGHRCRIAVHGSMDEAECANCHAKMDFDHFCDLVRRQIKDIAGQDPSAPKESRAIVCEECGHRTVKPSIVLFRSKLPDVFFNSIPGDVKDVDLLIIMGTSLAVAPANSIVWKIPKSAMRVLINRESVGGHLGFDRHNNDRDFFARGDCECVVLDLMEKLGWLQDLRPLLERNNLPESSAHLLQQRLDELDQKLSPHLDENAKSDVYGATKDV
jgi:NAD+-dependent protein deacetylase sirtuin 2